MDIEENTPVEGGEELVEQDAQLDKKWAFKPGSIIIILVALIGLAFIIWLIYSIWSLSSDDDGAHMTPQQPDAAETGDQYVDPTIVPDRDPEVLGLRIDSILGRFFTERATGKTLYINDRGCNAECLKEWTPYLSDEAVVDGGNFGTTERDNGELQYSWKGKGLYTYQRDSHDSVLGDGHSGTWHIARP